MGVLGKVNAALARAGEPTSAVLLAASLDAGPTVEVESRGTEAAASLVVTSCDAVTDICCCRFVDDALAGHPRLRFRTPTCFASSSGGTQSLTLPPSPLVTLHPPPSACDSPPAAPSISVSASAAAAMAAAAPLHFSVRTLANSALCMRPSRG